MHIKIIQIGKIKNTYLKEGEREFIKRLNPYAKIEMVEVKDEKRLQLEDEFVVVLDERGKEMTSVEFAKFLKTFKDRGENLNFVIGGAYGLSEELKEHASELLALSKMTFTHQMVRLFLLEQLYRGVCIILKKEYHNA